MVNKLIVFDRYDRAELFTKTIQKGVYNKTESVITTDEGDKIYVGVITSLEEGRKYAGMTFVSVTFHGKISEDATQFLRARVRLV